MEDILTKMNRFYNLISNYKEGGPDTRYKSWEWCHHAFLSKKDDYLKSNDIDEKESIIDYLSLHLAFYLASWGMYRGSSYLLQRDYKAHKTVVREILKIEYKELWDYVPENNNIESTNDLLFNEKYGTYWIIKDCYKGFDDEIKDESSDTLTTKILMGTFGCVPAFDRFLKSGIKYFQENHDKRKTRIGNYKLTQSIEKADSKTATESFKALASFALEHKTELNIDKYPLMKCVDMYFWEIGYEMDIADGLSNEKNKKEKKDKLLKTAKKLMQKDYKNYKEAIEDIHKKNS